MTAKSSSEAMRVRDSSFVSLRSEEVLNCSSPRGDEVRLGDVMLGTTGWDELRRHRSEGTCVVMSRGKIDWIGSTIGRGTK